MDINKSLSWVFSISRPEPLKSFEGLEVEDIIKISGEIVLFCTYLLRVNDDEINRFCNTLLRNLYFSLKEKHPVVFDPSHHSKFIIIYRLFFMHGLRSDLFTIRYVDYYKNFNFHKCELPQWELYGIKKALETLENKKNYTSICLDFNAFFNRDPSCFLLDDNAYDLTHIIMYLSDFGYSVVNEEKWLEYLKKHIDYWMYEYANVGHTDIVCELLIVSFHLNHLVRFDWQDYLHKKQHVEGYFTTSNEEMLSLSQNNSYLKHYHTTYVAIIAILLMDN